MIVHDELSSTSNNLVVAGQAQHYSAVLSLIELDGFNYDEYFKKLDEMIDSLRQHWKLEERVKSLKIIIQLSKLLADTSQLKLYAKKYKLITEALDEFGRMIQTRIEAIANAGCCEEKNGYELSGNSGVNLRYDSKEENEASKNNTFTSSLDESNLDKAKDICRNWFLKIASIRELVPRFYTELAILKVCDVLLNRNKNNINNNQAHNNSSFSLNEEQFYSQSLRRLTKTAWGFGDPIVAIYSRAYLCKVAQRLINWDENEKNANTLFQIILDNLEASARLIRQLNAYKIRTTLAQQKLDSVMFFELYSNGLQAMINLVTLRPDLYNDENDNLTDLARPRLTKMFDLLMIEAKRVDCCNYSKNILIQAATRALPADIVSENAEEILNIIQETHIIWRESCKMSPNVISTTTTTTIDVETTVSIAKPESSVIRELQMISTSLFSTISSFALVLDSSDEFELNYNLKKKKQLLNSIRVILEDLYKYEEVVENNPMSSSYLSAFKAWFSYANHYLFNQDDKDEQTILDKLLGDFVQRIKKDRQYMNQQVIISELIKILFSNRKTLQEIKQIVCQLKAFPQLLDLLSKDDFKLEVARWILETIRANMKLNKLQNDGNTTIADKPLINFILKLSAIINNALNPLTPNDDIDHLSQLIIFFLQIINIPNHREHLEFFSRCRGSMGNLNPLLEYLARGTLELAVEYMKTERKRNLKRNFLNGCLAFTFTTIPAIYSSLKKIQLYLEGTQLALNHMSLSLADYYLRQALLILEEQVWPDIKANEQLTSNDQLQENDKRGVGGGAEEEYLARNYRSSSIYSINNNPSANNNSQKAKRRFSKRLVDQVSLLLNLIITHEEHIDLKHKLSIGNLVRNSMLREDSNLFHLLRRLKVIDDDDDVDDDYNDRATTNKEHN